MMEPGYPAHNQAEVFHRAKEIGYFATAHGGDSGAKSVEDMLTALKPERIGRASDTSEDDPHHQINEKSSRFQTKPGTFWWTYTS